MLLSDALQNILASDPEYVYELTYNLILYK